jgi:hypothetical protein
LASLTSVNNIEKTSAVPVSGGNSRIGLTILWVLAILIFGIGDVFTTAVVLGLGGAEDNAIIAGLMQISGGSIWPLTLIKGGILSLLLLLSYAKLGSYAWMVPAALTGTGAYLLMHNIAALMILL